MQVCRKVWALVALFLLIPASSVLAHGETGLPQGLQLVFSSADANPDAVIAAGGNLLIRDSDTTWSFLCAEALGVLSRALDGGRIHQTRDGDLLLGTFSGLLRARSDRCAWEPVSPFMSRAVVVLAAGLQDSVYAVTGTGDGQDAAFVSDDGGRSWQVLFELDEGLWYSELLPAPSRPGRLYLSGTIFDADSMTTLPVIARSDDGGDTLAVTTLDEAWGRFRVLLVDPMDEDVLLGMYIEQLPEHTLTDLVGGLAHVLLSTDGGVSWSAVAQVAELLAVTRTPNGGKVWVSDGAGTLLLSTDRGRTFNAINEGLVLSCLDHVDGALWACADLSLAGFSVGVSPDDGATFEPATNFDEVVGPRGCDDDPDVAEVCMAQWQTWQFWFPGRDAGDVVGDAGPPTDRARDSGAGETGGDGPPMASSGADGDSSRGGCTASPVHGRPGPWPWAVLVLTLCALWALRRRRCGDR